MKSLSKLLNDNPKQKLIFGRPTNPRYNRSTILKDINAFINAHPRRSGSNSLGLSDINGYVAYLTNRYPWMRGHINKIDVHDLDTPLKRREKLNDILVKFKKHVDSQRSKIKKSRLSLIHQKGRCDACHISLAPVLNIHHVIPLTEGGSNELVCVLCPNCHAVLHKLIQLRFARRPSIELQEIEWWLSTQQSSNQWWGKAKPALDSLANIYYDHLNYDNFDLFLSELKKEPMREWLHFVDETDYQIRLFKYE